MTRPPFNLDGGINNSGVMQTRDYPSRACLSAFIALVLFFYACLSGSAQHGPGAVRDQPGTRAQVLDPDLFAGQTARAYQAAKSCPTWLLRNLFSYAGDDVCDGHTSLLDCFTTTYGADDPSCQEEVLMAADLYAMKTPIGEIQRAIDEKFSRMYPFAEDSAALKAYKRARLWDKPNYNKSKWMVIPSADSAKSKTYSTSYVCAGYPLAA